MKELAVIDGVAVEGSLFTRRFACDVLKCKGACCSLPGGRGAPLLNSEIEQISDSLPAVLPLLSDEKRDIIKRIGFFEGEPGDYATTCIDDRDCIFVYREEEVAKCALERAFNDGKSSFRKPISCHLYPIRVNRFGGDVLRYHEIPDCRPAVARGESENIKVFEFVRTALVRQYGEDWFSKLAETAASEEASAGFVSVITEKSSKDV
jgi:hypothetical protein